MFHFASRELLMAHVFPTASPFCQSVALYRGVGHLREAWSIPWRIYRENTRAAHAWWDRALTAARQRGLVIESTIVTSKGQAGFCFHTPKSTYWGRRDTDPWVEWKRLRAAQREGARLPVYREAVQRAVQGDPMSDWYHPGMDDNESVLWGMADDCGMSMQQFIDCQL